jgi:hypothetical protein
MLLRVFALACALAFTTPAAARAADGSGSNTTATPAVSASSSGSIGDAAAPLPAWVVTTQAKRPLALSALYGSYGALAVADFVSTRKAIAAGATEMNPVVGTGANARMVLVKTAGASMSIYFAERMWKKNKVGAIVTMAVVNGISAAVVARNARLANRR